MNAPALYVVRHGATAFNLAQPYRLLGQRLDPPLACPGVQQAKAARKRLMGVPLRVCYTSPLLRARQTADMLCAPHGLAPQVLDTLIECDLGQWEGLDWPTIEPAEQTDLNVAPIQRPIPA